jgi:predicted dehydrogenase
MSQRKHTRRTFLQSTAAAGIAASTTPYWLSSQQARADEPKSKSDRHVIGCIGTGSRWYGVVGDAMKFGDVAAVCDVDRSHLEAGRERVGGKAEMHEDYRRVLDNKDIDVVTIVTPDHWHTKIAIEAMQAGKDVYCEKPLTLTIDEGKKICQVQKQTGQVFQVGTQQRSEMSALDPVSKKRYSQQFLRAVALAHEGRLGKIRRVTCSIGGVAPSPSLPKAEIPSGLNWDMWLGQTPLVDYVSAPSRGQYPFSRCHYEFRWWYEYSGGKLTDWGAHHVDIAQWAIGMDHSGPTNIEGTAKHPVPMKNGYPTIDNQYNCATTFNIKCMFPNGVEMVIRDEPSNGVWIEGEDAEIFVSRGELKDIRGSVIAELAEKPIADEMLLKLAKGKKLGAQAGAHMRNFMACIEDRSLPNSDVYTHHRAITTCHLANIAIRLGRAIKWDPQQEQIVGDDEANSFVSRKQRAGYEIKV